LSALPFWNALWRTVIVGTLATVAAAGLEGWIYRLRLYRTRKFRAPTGHLRC
jgi:ABC-type sugar transport system permease subunit